MFPNRVPCIASSDAVEELARFMAHLSNGNTSQSQVIAAGFTYLGQFIDHDLTFDPTPLTDRGRDPHARVDFRTPRFDLDSVYGLGPEIQPFLYDWKADPEGARMLIGDSDGVTDLPRNDPGRALVGDPRNDENVIISQLHLLFLQFHNAVVDQLEQTGKIPPQKRFAEARRIVRFHYQWIVVNEFLPMIVGKRMAERVLKKRWFFKPTGRVFMPVEFSGAAYRYGHSMVRERYGLKRAPADGPAPPATPFTELFGRRPLTQEHVIDWDRLFDMRPPDEIAQEPDLPFDVVPSMEIDTILSPPLLTLPDGDEAVLARRNLLRGIQLGLPSGQDIADAIHAPALEPGELGIDADVRFRKVLLGATPLWYYVLAEAKAHANGQHLGRVGGRIVGEVLVGLLEADAESYLRADPHWKPGELGTGEHFTMATLVRFAQAPAHVG